MVVQLARIIAVFREVEDKVARRMFLIQKHSDRANVVLVERIVMRIGHSCVGQAYMYT